MTIIDHILADWQRGGLLGMDDTNLVEFIMEYVMREGIRQESGCYQRVAAALRKVLLALERGVPGLAGRCQQPRPCCSRQRLIQGECRLPRGACSRLRTTWSTTARSQRGSVGSGRRGVRPRRCRGLRRYAADLGLELAGVSTMVVAPCSTSHSPVAEAPRAGQARAAAAWPSRYPPESPT